MKRLAALCAALLGCVSDNYPHLYRSSPLAPGYAESDVSSLAHLGATRLPTGVNFSVYAQHATRVRLAIFEDGDSNVPTRQFDMTRYGDVWNVFVEGVGLGTIYGYIAWGPNWPSVPSWQPGTIDGFIADVDAAGNRYDPNKLLFDPYSRALNREFDWSRGSIASGPDRTQLDWGAAVKSVVVESTYQWSANETAWRAMRQSNSPPVGHRWQDLIVYEVHPKGFTADAASGVTHPGTFRGIGENADYLKNLGITAVELMPTFEKPTDGGYWGYQTIGFFTPELSYASDQRPGYVQDEFKWMVDQLHQRGIEVLLDVVYNHTGEGGLWREKLNLDNTPDPIANLGNFDPKEVAGLYSFRGLDNAAYYALQSDRGFFWDNTGVGDDSRCNNTPMRQLVMDSLHYWSEEMHADGFRFDLAPILGEDDLNYNTFDPANTLLQKIIDDPALQSYHTRIIAEPWSVLGSYLSQFPAASNQGGVGWYEWNGGFRDWWREFANYDGTSGYIGNCGSSSTACNTPYWSLHGTEYGKDGGFFMTGSSDWFGSTRSPYNSVNFITVHDGFTMYDLMSYPIQLNGCGPLNPVCCDSPASAFCDPTSGTQDNRSRNWTDESFKRQQIRNLFTAMMIAPGTPMILGGDEWMRTQLGNNNAYTTEADNPSNWFDWGTWIADSNRQAMHDFVAQLIAFRKSRADAFALASYPVQFQWESETLGTPNWDSKHIAQYYSSASPKMMVLINMESGGVDFQLPQGIAWRRILDTQSYFEGSNVTLGSPTPIPGSDYNVVGHSIVVLQAAE